jgi:CelD/BcsL family acetyltransferase involved in cellulose biosynthesis
LNYRSLDIACVKQEEQFHSLLSEWNRLAEATGLDSVFLRHEWFQVAWQWAKQDAELRILCMRDGSDLVGICPLIRRRSRHRGLITHALEFLTVPDTQLCDILVAPESRHDVLHALIQHLQQTRREWDVLILDKLPRTSGAAESLQTALHGEGFGGFIESAGSNLYVRLDEGWKAFYGRRSRRLKKGNNLVANHLKKAHSNIDIQWFHGTDIDTRSADNALEIAMALSSRSWKRSTGLTLDRVGPDGIPIAAEYQLIYKRKIHALRADFDSAYEELSPGTYLNWKLLEKLFDYDAEYYYMGPGGRPYKKRWAEGFEALDRVVGFGKTFRGRTLDILECHALPVARRILRR